MSSQHLIHKYTDKIPRDKKHGGFYWKFTNRRTQKIQSCQVNVICRNQECFSVHFRVLKSKSSNHKSQNGNGRNCSSYKFASPNVNNEVYLQLILFFPNRRRMVHFRTNEDEFYLIHCLNDFLPYINKSPSNNE